MDEKRFNCNPKEKNMEANTAHNPRTIFDTGINPQTYLFEFGSDEKLYSISFYGNILPGEVKKILESARNCLYEKMAENIHAYLEQQHLEYANFTVSETVLRHETVMSYTNNLLHSESCDIINRHIENANIYYGTMDHQQWNENGCHEGCYYILKRVVAGKKETYKYKIIGQTFNYDRTEDEEHSYFAIRTNNGSSFFHNIDAVRGEPVIPTFGCIDMMGLLLNIDNINTAKQAERIAVK